jgi:flavin reductase (DIM6/NTAB) family NADH-FMN oxidoreductase RutF
METSIIRTDTISTKERYQLLSSLVVPRPIGWLGTFSKAGVPNLAPFSFYAALSATPMLVGASIGQRKGEAKDTLTNVRETGAFTVNVVTEPHLEAMNATSGDYPADIDEFRVAGLSMARAESIHAPYVADCPAVFECRLFQEVELRGASNAFVIGEVFMIRLDSALHFVSGTRSVETGSLKPVARLWASAYALLGKTIILPRPKIE